MAKKNKSPDSAVSRDLARRLSAAHDQLRAHAARANRAADDLAGLLRRFEASIHLTKPNGPASAKAPRSPRTPRAPRARTTRRPGPPQA